MRVVRVPMIMGNEMTIVKRYSPSPIGAVMQLYDGETDMYLGHVVFDTNLEVFVCTRIDAHDCDTSHWNTNDYDSAIGFVECAAD